MPAHNPAWWSRRHLLRHAAIAALPLAMGPGRLWAAGDAHTPRLLVVFLRGGYDALSLLVPYTRDGYYAARPTLAVPRPGHGTHAAVMLDRQWALHPATAAGLMPLWQRGQLAFVPFAGSDNLSRRHFETQDVLERGQPALAPGNDGSGWLNRLAGTLGTRDATAFSHALPLALRGPHPVSQLALGGTPGPADVQARRIGERYTEPPLGGAVVAAGVDGTRPGALRALQAESQAGLQADLQAEMVASARGAPGAHGFEGQARRLGRLMRTRAHIGFVDVGGWDTHIDQARVLPPRLGALARGMAALADEMAPVWQRSVVVVVSEFGRTLRENALGGTDHGHGSVYWVLGGGVRGGRIAGVQPPVDDASPWQQRDLPVLNDARSLFGGLLSRLYGLSSSQLQAVLPDSTPQDIALL